MISWRGNGTCTWPKRQGRQALGVVTNDQKTAEFYQTEAAQQQLTQ